LFVAGTRVATIVDTSGYNGTLVSTATGLISTGALGIALAPQAPAVVAGITVNETNGNAVAESGTTDTFTLVLTSQPTADVVVTPQSSASDEVTVSGALTFTTANWNVAQTVTVTGVDDADVDGVQTATITFVVASNDTAYNALTVAAVTVSNADDDIAPPAPTGACCNPGDSFAASSCASVGATTCSASQFFVPTGASACAASLCCPAAASEFECPSTANSLKLIALESVNGSLVPHTVCISGWDSADATALGSSVVRTLSITSSEAFVSAPPLDYTCALGNTAGAEFASSLQCSGSEGREILYQDCHAFCFTASGNLCSKDQDQQRRKRQPAVGAPVGSGGSFALASSATGDPHLRGASGTKYDLKGVAGGVYALFVSPVFAVNAQLATTGPEVRFMTKLAVLYRGTVLVFTPWTWKQPALIAQHFAALNATVRFHGHWAATITFCATHSITLSTMHTLKDTPINYFDVAVRVPGCHDAFGGALGSTYQCQYVQHRKTFDWSAEREETFRVANLSAPSGTYSAGADCAHEDEYGELFLESGGSATAASK